MTNLQKGQNKRRYPRRDFTARVGVLIKGKYFVESAFELGERGMLFITEMALSDREDVVISFAMPDGYVVITRAQVRYIIKVGNGLKAGVEFTNISFEERRKVRDFIAKRKDKVTTDELTRLF